MRFTAAVTNEPPWYVARCLEVEVTSQGVSVDDALANLKEALELYFENEPFPEGVDPPLIETVDRGVTSRLPVVSGKEAARALRHVGFEQVSQRGSHLKLRRADGRVVIVPLHRTPCPERFGRSFGRPESRPTSYVAYSDPLRRRARDTPHVPRGSSRGRAQRRGRP